MRTHNCGELNKKYVGKKVKLCGWVDKVRVHGKVGFIDLKDRYGITQLFIGKEFVNELTDLRKESIVRVEGEVKKKPKPNKQLATGDIEVSAKKFEVINNVPPLPLEIEGKSTDKTRMKYRYLDLRSKRMFLNITIRHKTIKAIRDFLDNEGFLEIETPILAKSTPEGARDYLVPSRVHKGKFYALPQSPQLFKQLCMIAGFDKYFQIARCFRDEDLRAERQPEFTQLDLEMSFITQDELFGLLERLMKYVFKCVLNINIKTPFQRISYEESMKKYKTDKPDLRKKKNEWKFLWVVDFPLWDKSENGKLVSMHHPFTMPKDVKEIGNIKKAKSKAYDLVLNGSEVS